MVRYQGRAPHDIERYVSHHVFVPGGLYEILLGPSIGRVMAVVPEITLCMAPALVNTGALGFRPWLSLQRIRYRSFDMPPSKLCCTYQLPA
jgi:hypothetical protein